MQWKSKNGASSFRDWLQNTGVANIKNVNAALAAASPWYTFYGASSADALA